MPRRTVAALVLVPAIALSAAGCTATDGDGEPAPDGSVPRVVATVDLDAAAGTEVRPSDLAALPGGTALVLLTAPDDAASYLLEIGPDGAGPPRTVPAVRDGADLLVAPDGTVHVVGRDATTGELQISTGERVTPLGRLPDTTAGALSPDGRTAYLAVTYADGRPPELLAVDLASGTTTAAEPADPVTHLAATTGGGLTALEVTGSGAALTTYGADLRPTGDPTVLSATDRPAGLAVTPDGTAVLTLDGGDSGQLLTVSGGEVGQRIDLADTEDSGLDLAVSPDGRSAVVPLSAYQAPPALVTYDLGSGEPTGEVVLCPGGNGALGATALSPDGGTLTAIGVCRDENRVSTAFLVR
ncbi:hypothetical protein [Blastococcus sp. SYSU D00820]